MKKWFDGEDYIYSFDDKVIVHYEDVNVIENLYAENIPLFTSAYLPCAGDVVVDIGAGNGYDIQEFSRIVGSKGRVIAIEADPDCFRRLSKLVALAKLENVECVFAAVSDSSTQLHLIRNHIGGISNYLDSKPEINSIPISPVRLDDVFRSLKVKHINLIKFNIEGHEFRALCGMLEYLPSTYNLIVACHDFLGKPKMNTKSQVKTLLLKSNFVVTNLINAKKDWEKDYLFGVNFKHFKDYFVKITNARYEMQNKLRGELELKNSIIKSQSHRIEELTQFEIRLKSIPFYYFFRYFYKSLRIVYNYVHIWQQISLRAFGKFKQIFLGHQ